MSDYRDSKSYQFQGLSIQKKIVVSFLHIFYVIMPRYTNKQQRKWINIRCQIKMLQYNKQLMHQRTTVTLICLLVLKHISLSHALALFPRLFLYAFSRSLSSSSITRSPIPPVPYVSSYLTLSQPCQFIYLSLFRSRAYIFCSFSACAEL